MFDDAIDAYARATTWGRNDFAVFEDECGTPVVRAAGPLAHCLCYLEPGCILVDARPYRKA